MAASSVFDRGKRPHESCNVRMALRYSQSLAAFEKFREVVVHIVTPNDSFARRLAALQPFPKVPQQVPLKLRKLR